MLRLTYHSTAIMLIFAPIPKCLLGRKPTIFKQIRLRVSKYASDDRPETGISSSLFTSQEVNPNLHFHTPESPNPTFHTYNVTTCWWGRIPYTHSFTHSPVDGQTYITGDSLTLIVTLILTMDWKIAFSRSNYSPGRMDGKYSRRVGWYNFRNGTAKRTVIGRNGTLILTLCLTLPLP